MFSVFFFSNWVSVQLFHARKYFVFYLSSFRTRTVFLLTMFTVNDFIIVLILIAQNKNISSHENLFYCEMVHAKLLYMLSFQRIRNNSLYRV